MQGSPADIARQKAELRRTAAAGRDRMAAAAASDLPDLMAETALDQLRGRAVTVASGYWPIRSEIDVRPLLRLLAGLGWTPALPAVVTRGDRLAFRRWDLDELNAEDACGIPAPDPGADILVPELMLVPLLAFDRRGYRLGYGGGYYDRTLAALRPGRQVLAVGVAYAAQERNDIPVHEGDQRLDAILTERAWVWSGTGEETR